METGITIMLLQTTTTLSLPTLDSIDIFQWRLFGLTADSIDRSSAIKRLPVRIMVNNAI